jgi:methyl-accepting chemotaxis protein
MRSRSSSYFIDLEYLLSDRPLSWEGRVQLKAILDGEVKDFIHNLDIDDEKLNEKILTRISFGYFPGTISENSISNDVSINSEKVGITEEREKRLILLKKVHKKHTEDIDLLNQALSTLRNDASQALLSVSDDIKALNKEVSRLRDNDIVVMRDQVDDLLIRRYGKVPTTSGNDYYGLENLTDKINQLDSRLEDDEVAEAEIEKMKLSRDKKITLVDIAKRHQKPSIDIDETITDLQVKINTLIDDMSSVKKTSIEALKKSRKNGNNETTGYDSDFEELVTKLQRKVKVISEQSTLGFAGLSSGLNEVQQTTIELYNFAEKVHKSFEVVSQKLNLGRNILPNITMPEFVITALNKN